MTAVDEPLLQISDLSVRYGFGRGTVAAVQSIDLNVGRGQVVGLVGESGSGKSTIGNSVLGLAPVSAGTIRFDGQDISHLGRRERRVLSRDLQAIFQNPYGSLNPTRTVGTALAEPLRAQRADRQTMRRRVTEVLDMVGMPSSAASRYPREFSGGQRQRIAIARAFVLSPKLIICDEPVSALDLSIQAQILNLLSDLRRDLNVSLLFISHDLSVVRYLSDVIVVLQAGHIVEQGPAAQIYDSPKEDYTRALLAAVPAHPRRRHRIAVTPQPGIVAPPTSATGPTQ